MTHAASSSRFNRQCSDEDAPRLGESTLSVHAGESRQKAGDSITDPIFCASTFTFTDSQSVIDYIEQKIPREEYGRYGNPTVRRVEERIAALENGQDAILFPTGINKSNKKRSPNPVDKETSFCF